MNANEDWNEEDDTPGLAFELSHTTITQRSAHMHRRFLNEGMNSSSMSSRLHHGHTAGGTRVNMALRFGEDTLGWRSRSYSNNHCPEVCAYVCISGCTNENMLPCTLLEVKCFVASAVQQRTCVDLLVPCTTQLFHRVFDRRTGLDFRDSPER